MEPISCDNCKGVCPYSYGQRKAYFSTTAYGGRLCGTGCALSWILKCKKNKTKGNIIGCQEGNIKMVHTRNHAILNI